MEVEKLLVRRDELQPLRVQMQLTPALTARACHGMRIYMMACIYVGMDHVRLCTVQQ